MTLAFNSVKTSFDLTIDKSIDSFSNVQAIASSELLKLTLKETMPLVSAINTEKERSKLLIAPILLETRRQLHYQVSRLNGVRGLGMYWITCARPKTQLDIRTKTVTIEPQETVTADSTNIKVNAVLYYRILDPPKAINKVENYELAVYQTALTSLRNVVGQNILDDVLQDRDKINDKVQEIVDQVTEPWGVVIERVEMKDVEIPLAM